VLANNPLNLEFRRVLSEPRWTAWLHLVQRLMFVNLNAEEDNFVWKLSNLNADEDNFVWKLTTSRVFSVKSMYADLMNRHSSMFKSRFGS
jgi:hypothetical protein